MFSFFAIAEDEKKCLDPQGDPCEELVVTGEKPNPTEGMDEFNKCMYYLGDAHACSEGTVSGNDPAAPTNSASDSCEGSGCINYEDSYDESTNNWLPLCPDFVKDALILGGLIGTSVQVTVTPSNESMVEKLMKKAPGTIAKVIRVGSGTFLIIDLVAFTYCELVE